MTVSAGPNNIDIDAFRGAMLGWYDRNRRVLPWRGASSPYHVWLSEIMLQQTTVPAVIPYFLKFTQAWPDVHALAAAPQEDVMREWAGLGYYARARNLHKCAGVVSHDLGGIFPDTEEALRELPGIGPYTAAAIASIAFGKPATVVDGNIERVMARLHALKEPMPASKPALRGYAGLLAEGRADRPGDYAQSLMDLGASVCLPKAPKCMLCPVGAFCRAREEGSPDIYPLRREKGAKPQKYGYFYWIERKDGAVLFERRPEKGMLGGMIGLPTSPWVEDRAAITASGLAAVLKPVELPHERLVRHSFTHFDLELAARRYGVTKSPDLPGSLYIWVSPQDIGGLGLPTLFRKAVRLMT